LIDERAHASVGVGRGSIEEISSRLPSEIIAHHA